MKYVGWAVLLLAGLLLLKAVTTGIGLASWFAGQAVETAKKELSPQELLRKYEWFKDASAQLDKKKADIGVYQSKLKRYANVDPLKVPRYIAEQMTVWEQELAGVKASYNDLAAEYNSQMAKFNWRFTNVGDLPAGESQVLPRAYRTYQDS